MRDVTPDMDSKVDFIGDFQPFLPPLYAETVTFISINTLTLNLDQLEKMCRPSSGDRAYKIVFWRLLRSCEMQERQMTDSEARCGILSKVGLQHYSDNSVLLTWLLSPEIPAEVVNEVRLQELMKIIDEVITFDPTDLEKKINYKLLDSQIKIYNMLDKRVNGEFLQRIDQRNLNINQTEKPKKKEQLNEAEKIKQLEDSIAKASSMGGNNLDG